MRERQQACARLLPKSGSVLKAVLFVERPIKGPESHGSNVEQHGEKGKDHVDQKGSRRPEKIRGRCHFIKKKKKTGPGENASVWGLTERANRPTPPPQRELYEMRSPAAAAIASGKKMKFEGEPKKPPS